MKLIFFALNLSIIVLCSGSNFVNPGLNNNRRSDIYSALTLPEYLLTVQQQKRAAVILDALSECNETQPVPWNEAMELFQNALPGVIRFTNESAKCLIDCVMRKSGVMTDEGFQEKVYLMHVKQLRFNYTSYDINKEEPDKKEQILTAINKFSIANKKQSYEIIKNYEWAAHECKDAKDPNNDNKCETSFRVARCIANRCRERGFNSPFYPIQFLKP